MSPTTVGALGFVILLVLLFMGMPVGFVMSLVGFAGFAYLSGFDSALGLLRNVPYSTVASYGLTVVPLFVLMGSFCFYAGLSKDLYDTAHKWLGHLPGGLSMATVGACAGFAAVSGSSIATAITMGTVALPEMKRYNYDPALATGSIAAGGTIGILIPPSIALVVYGIITEVSIGKLFLAGFIPGVLEAVFYIITIYIICRFNPRLGPPAARTSFVQKIVSLKNTWSVLILFLLVIGGIYIGVFSPTEAAGVGAFGAFAIAMIRRKLGWQQFKKSFVETVSTTAMMFTILIGAMILSYFMAISRLPSELAAFVGGLQLNNYLVITGILVLYVILGCVFDPIAMILLTIPIFFPLVVSMGFSPVWFGIIIVRVIEIGLITPPIGLNVYVIAGVARDVPMLVAFPSIALFLPSMMKG
ncbi:MAG: TRAP transporter large permease [Chloroflexota bacterium]